MKNFVKNPALAKQGFLNLDFAEQHMRALLEVRKRFAKEKPFQGLRISMALHVTKETGVLARTLKAGGAQVALASCNPLSTQDDVAAALAKEGVNVFAYKGESRSDYYKFIKNVIAAKPHITIDDGGDLVSEIHNTHGAKQSALLSTTIGGTEETTTGLIRLRAMAKDGALKYPIIAVNDNRTKHLFDNYYGTGQSTLDGILRATNILFAGKTVAVAGYGDCGKGVALRAKGLGARVIVAEVNPIAALQAYTDGFSVMPMDEACSRGDIFITVTGNRDILTARHFLKMKDGAILANAGHFDVEIDVQALAKISKRVRRVRHYLDEYALKNGKKLYLAGEGRLVNLVVAEGHPSEVMSLSFCGQALACEYLVKHRGKLKPGVHVLPNEMDEKIACLQLKALGVEYDKPTPLQKKYISSWKKGT